MNLIEIMQQAKKIAQYNAPFDTGNLRYNAIHAYPLHDQSGFKVIVKYTVAYYGAILDEYGAGPKRKHKGWWSVAVANDIAKYIDGVNNGKSMSYQNENEHVAKFAPNNPQRKKRFRSSQIKDR
jgi:hypothetical protein